MKYAIQLSRYALLIVVCGFLLLVSSLPVAAQTVINGYTVTYNGLTGDGVTTTFTYTVAGTGVPPDLSHFNVGIPLCEPSLDVVAHSPIDAVDFGVDPTTGVAGIKWDLPLGMNDSRTYSITFAGEVSEGEVIVAVKGGNGFESAMVAGPACPENILTVEKYVSIDGGLIYADADDAPGPNVPLDGEVTFLLVITNTGSVDVSNITLADSVFDASTCAVPPALAPGAFFDCNLGPFPVVEGQHTNIATATAISADGTALTASDSANYFGGEQPAIDLQKLVSVDGGASFNDADAAPGPQVDPGDDVYFRFIVTNTGTTDVFDVDLRDDTLDMSGCDIASELAPTESTECTIGPIPAIDGQHVNTATVTAGFSVEEIAITASDSAYYFGIEDGDDLTTIIIIVGPVQAIDGNIITVWGITIQLDPDDPILLTLQIGDIVNITGTMVDDSGVIVIVVISITIVNIVVIDPGDPGGGGNPGGGNGPVTICHKGRNTLTVPWSAWINGHSGHGDTLGACS